MKEIWKDPDQWIYVQNEDEYHEFIEHARLKGKFKDVKFNMYRSAYGPARNYLKPNNDWQSNEPVSGFITYSSLKNPERIYELWT